MEAHNSVIGYCYYMSLRHHLVSLLGFERILWLMFFRYNRLIRWVQGLTMINLSQRLVMSSNHLIEVLLLFLSYDSPVYYSNSRSLRIFYPYLGFQISNEITSSLKFNQERISIVKYWHFPDWKDDSFSSQIKLATEADYSMYFGNFADW